MTNPPTLDDDTRRALEEAAIALYRLERVAFPGLAFHRDHVAVSGQHDAAGDIGAQCGVEIGLPALGIEAAPARHAVAFQALGNEVDQLHVRLGRNRVEGDLPFDHLQGRRRSCGHLQSSIASSATLK